MTEKKYKIEMGISEMLDGTTQPKHTVLISEEQYNIILLFANVEHDSDMNKYYILNASKFKIVPYFETNKC